MEGYDWDVGDARRHQLAADAGLGGVQRVGRTAGDQEVAGSPENRRRERDQGCAQKLCARRASAPKPAPVDERHAPGLRAEQSGEREQNQGRRAASRPAQLECDRAYHERRRGEVGES